MSVSTQMQKRVFQQWGLAVIAYYKIASEIDICDQ